MKSKFLITLLVGLGALSHGKETPSPSEQAEIYLSENDRISGNVESMSGDKIAVTTPFSAKAWSIHRPSVKSIFFERPLPTDSPLKDRIYVRNDAQEVIPAHIRSIDENRVVADTHFSKSLSLPRSAVESLQFSTVTRNPLFAEPLMSEGCWTDNMPSENVSIFTSAFKRVNPGNHDPKVVHLPPMPWTKLLKCDLNSFEIVLSYSLGALPEGQPVQGVTLMLQGKIPDETKPQTDWEELNLMIRLDQNTWYLSTKSDSTEQQLLEVPAPQSQGKKQDLVIHVSKVDSELVLDVTLNGEKSKKVPMGIPMLKDACFMINPHIPQFFVHRLQLNKLWSSYDRDIPSGLDNQDVVDTTDDEWIPGRLLSYDGNKGQTVIMTGDERQLSIPSEFISSLYLAEPTADHLSDENIDQAVTRITLVDSSCLLGVAKSISNGKLSFLHPILGQISVPMKLIQRIDFFDQVPPRRSQP